MNRRPALPNKVCMHFDDERLEACGEYATEVARMELPLGALTAVQLQDVTRTRAEAMPKTSKLGYTESKRYRSAAMRTAGHHQEQKPNTYARRTETAAAHPSEGGCFIVVELYLCLEHIAGLQKG